MGKHRIQTEQEMKDNIIALARQQGVEDRVKKILQSMEDNIKNKTDTERKHIVHIGLIEIHKTIGCVDALVVDGIELLPAQTSYQEAINLTRGLVKLD